MSVSRTRPPLVFLPPSEGKAAGGRGAPWRPGTLTLPDLDERRSRLVAALGLEREPTLPAIERYTGVLYTNLAYDDLPATLRRRVDRQVLVFSGTWGAVAPRDPIPDYRNKMGRSLAGFGVLSRWWRPALEEALAPVVARRTVWNLLPNEHAAAWSPAMAGPSVKRHIRVRFLEERRVQGRPELITVSHWNKALKGALVRFVVTEQLEDPRGLAAFEHPAGYRLDTGLSQFGAEGDDVVLVKRAGVRRPRKVTPRRP